MTTQDQDDSGLSHAPRREPGGSGGDAVASRRRMLAPRRLWAALRDHTASRLGRTPPFRSGDSSEREQVESEERSTPPPDPPAVGTVADTIELRIEAIKDRLHRHEIVERWIGRFVFAFAMTTMMLVGVGPFYREWRRLGSPTGSDLSLPLMAAAALLCVIFAGLFAGLARFVIWSCVERVFLGDVREQRTELVRLQVQRNLARATSRARREPATPAINAGPGLRLHVDWPARHPDPDRREGDDVTSEVEAPADATD